MRTAIIFALCFAIGATAALIGRAAFHKPYREEPAAVHSPAKAAPAEPAGHEGMPSMGSSTPPAAAAPGLPATAAPPATAPAAPSTVPAPVSTGSPKVVNTICAICGMDVDPAIAPIAYQGQLVGFGCGACPPKFKREPDRYGPAALKNERVR